MIQIGPILRKRREELGLSQTALAAEVGMRQTDISKIETGQRRELNITTLERLTMPLRLRLELVPLDFPCPMQAPDGPPEGSFS